MFCVTVCVVLVALGNVESFGLGRTRRGLEQTILDVYGPPQGPTPTHHGSSMAYDGPHHKPLHSDHEPMRNAVQEHKPYIAQEVLDSIFGPQNKKSRQDEPSAPHFRSAIIGTTEQHHKTDSTNAVTKPTGNEETVFLQTEVAKLFGSPPPEPEGINTTNQTKTFENDDRFLSSSVLRGQFRNNLDMINAQSKTTKHDGEHDEESGPKDGVVQLPKKVDYDDRFLSETLLRQLIDTEKGKETSSQNPESEEEISERKLRVEMPEGDRFRPKKDEPRNLEQAPPEHVPANANPSESKLLKDDTPTQAPSSSTSNRNSVSNSLILMFVCFYLKSLVFI